MHHFFGNLQKKFETTKKQSDIYKERYEFFLKQTENLRAANHKLNQQNISSENHNQISIDRIHELMDLNHQKNRNQEAIHLLSTVGSSWSDAHLKRIIAACLVACLVFGFF